MELYINFFAHGSSKGMTLEMDGKTYKIRTVKQLDDFLLKHSKTWQNKKEGDKPVIVLHSCRVVQDQKDVTATFAQEISGSTEFKNTTVIVPNERVYINASREVGAYKPLLADENGEYLRNKQGKIKSKASSNTPGSWRIFKAVNKQDNIVEIGNQRREQPLSG